MLGPSTDGQGPRHAEDDNSRTREPSFVLSQQANKGVRPTFLAGAKRNINKISSVDFFRCGRIEHYVNFYGRISGQFE